MIYLSKPDITEKEKQAVLDVLNSGILASGPKVKEFEEKFAKYNNLDYAIAVSSGTTALHAALLGLGIGQGDKVLTTPFTFIATSNSILFCQATPVFCDINPKTFNLDPNKVEDILKKEDIKAMILVHLYGLPCDMDAFNFLADKYNVKIIEDCAQSVGATYKNKLTGSFGEAGCFSFYATKNMMTGEGGMITTSNPELDQKIRSLINHGRDSRFGHKILGYNFRTTDIAAALGIVQLDRLPGFIEKRRKNAAIYNKELAKIDWIKTPCEAKDYFHVFHQYTIRVPQDLRKDLLNHLKDNGIHAAPIYPMTITEQPFYKDKGYKNLENAETAAKEVISLPVHTKLEAKDLETVINAILSFSES